MEGTKLFISWSGDRSRRLAEALRDWLPKVIHRVRPWLSSADINGGKRWYGEIDTELEKAKIGLICLTPENIRSPWLMFEAGALSRPRKESLVCPLLLDLDPSNIEGPLEHFQATRLDGEGMMSLLKNINQQIGVNDLTDRQFAETFEMWWPSLGSKIEALVSSPPFLRDKGNLGALASPTSEQLSKIERALTDLLSEIERKSYFSKVGTHHGEAQYAAIERLINLGDKLLDGNSLDPNLAWQLADAISVIRDEREDIRLKIAEIIAMAEGYDDQKS